GPCHKGLSYIERVYSEDRILHPLKRNGNNSFTRISWEEALDTISGQLLSVREKYGSKSVLYYCGSGTKGLLNSVSMNFWKLYGGCTTTYGDLCWPSGLEATRLTFGENKHNSPWDLANAKTIIFWGKNAAETNIHQMVFADKVQENKGKVIVIDPRRTQTSERADLLIQPRPGTDGALALAVANLLFERKYIDENFIGKHVHGCDKFREMVKEYTTEKVSGITDVPAEYIVRLTEIIGKEKPVTICGGFGMQRYSNSGQTMRAMIALLAITGNIGKPGAGWQFANLQSHIFDEVKDPVASFPPEK
ncbi:MAG: molybdopterin-dependent oxidoreductase, partial [Planctomycetes bacterium]|nr:molybdopterin-dependent oxidoreductase [Planctomycetota bacterium]